MGEESSLAGTTFFARMRVNSSRFYLEKFVREAAESVEGNARVLDAGAGHAPYRGLFAHTRYDGADFCRVEDTPYRGIRYICDLAALPVAENTYDLAICTQVLEHLPEPALALEEIHRALRPGCRLWLSAPLTFGEHQAPHDYYRYTQYGLRYMLEKAGFEVVQIEALEGYMGLLSYQMGSAAKALPLSPKAYGGGVTGTMAAATAVVMKPWFYLLSQVFARLDRRSRQPDAALVKNYTVVAEKPVE